MKAHVTTPFASVVAWGERAGGALLAAVETRRWIGTLILLSLTVATYLPGVINLPPVDRTEVVFAETTAAMLARGDFIDARYGEIRHRFRPIGTYWLQAAAATLTATPSADDLTDDITPYRLPSTLGVILAVLACYWLLGPLIGNSRALIAATLFAVVPLVALEAHLAIADGIVLPASIIAMLALLRIYCARDDEPTALLAFAFWTAIGLGMLVNALSVPILVASALLALLVFDRATGWLRRLYPGFGFPLALVLASPWLIVRWQVDGTPFAGMPWGELLEALGGSQDMKWKAAPGTFTLAAMLGFLPGAVFAYPALRQLWHDREAKLARFLLAWIIGYLVYLEGISSKPAIYTVQAIFPALATALALAIMPPGANPALPKPSLAPHPVFAFLIMIGIFGGIGYAISAELTPLNLAAGVAVALLMAFAAAAHRNDAAIAWLVWSAAGFAGLVVYLFGVLLPGTERMWPATAIERAVAPLQACAPGPINVLGYREPSTGFELDTRADRTTPQSGAAMLNTGAYVAVERRWQKRFADAAAAANITLPQPFACVTGLNVMRGCRVNFAIYGKGVPQGCRPPDRFACSPAQLQAPAEAAGGRCD